MKFFHLIKIISPRCKKKCSCIFESTRGSRHKDRHFWVCAWSTQSLTYSDIYRLQTAAKPHAQWQQKLTAVISYPPFIRRLFLAACVSAGVRARWLNHTQRWQSASKVLVIFIFELFWFSHACRWKRRRLTCFAATRRVCFNRSL